MNPLGFAMALELDTRARWGARTELRESVRNRTGPANPLTLSRAGPAGSLMPVAFITESKAFHAWSAQVRTSII